MDLKNVEVTFAGTGKGSESYYDPAMVNALFGTKIKVVMGYKGGGQLDLSLERQETLGRAGPLISWIVRKQQWLKEGKIRILVQVGLKKFQGWEHVPLLIEFARNANERAMIKLISSRSASPAMRTLRPAFLMKSSDLIASAILPFSTSGPTSMKAALMMARWLCASFFHQFGLKKITSTMAP